MTKRLVINGRFLTQRVTGVQRVGIEFCLALDEMLSSGALPPEIEVEVLVPKSAHLVTPIAPRALRLRRAGWFSGHLWEQIALPLVAGRSELLNLGNTAPFLSLLASPHRTSVMVHDLSYRYFPAAYGRTFRWFYNLAMPLILWRARAIFTVSESERSAILREFPRYRRLNRIVAVQNGTMAVPSIARAPREHRARNCLYVGSLTKRKNAAGLLHAAIELARSHDAYFTFVGANGPNFEEVDVAIPEDVTDRIRFLGQVDDVEMLATEYERAAVFVFPSFYEASPLPPTEAMSHGCPVVVSDIPSLRERCGDAAIYCDPSTIDSIVKATVKLLDSPETWREYQARGFARAGDFTWETQVRRVLATALPGLLEYSGPPS